VGRAAVTRGHRTRAVVASDCSGGSGRWRRWIDTVLRTLRERSAALVPVEPRFHPDVAALLASMVDRAPISERQRKVAELNAWQPPEPEEWLPADAALPSDVADPKAACEHYSLLAEHLVALLHTQVPSVFKETPESLTDVTGADKGKRKGPRTRARDPSNSCSRPATDWQTPRSPPLLRGRCNPLRILEPLWRHGKAREFESHDAA
jgi:hypothetical protein